MPSTLRSDDLRDVLRIGQATVSLRLWQGKIPGYLIRHSWIAFRSGVREWLASTADGPLPPHEPDRDPLDAFGDVLTVSEVAGLFRLSRQSITGWLRDGVLGGRFDGRPWLVEKGAILELLREGSNRP
ncbi:DNA-binding protein [Clavibacter michiganensis subsp. insidiosus]|uniref:DNA-binding protein n=3 Tax=Clavibacter michiganensis TaxID=28447 RepID=A0A0D5CN64_9MICO|nr:DNA-binding protein [Clavibacter michiganensis subsp. insidiosus]AWF99943.1 DNA-binding protein [Clavibacter michiganensis subsp. insidiosus]RIJ45040.1 DNA-binding protein [Clavibacter michiganensis subsp. insidiosus]